MKRYLLFFCLILTVLSSCKKKEKDDFDYAAQVQKDDDQIKAYLAANNITAVKDASGLYYQIITAGSAEKPTIGNGAGVFYEGKLMSDGTVFESSLDKLYYRPTLADFIEGWQIGLQKIGKGGRMMLYIPSGLAYKNQATGKIPANAVLIFDVTLVNFN